MAKKVRRVRRSRAGANPSRQPHNQATTSTASTKPRQDPAERFRQEYGYVIRDLRHVLFLALAMFVLLILLNLILPHLV